MKVLICLNTAWNLVNFRSGLIKALVAQGYEVVAVAPHDAYADRLAALGCRFVPLPMDNRGTHPGRDGLLLWRFWRLLRQERPDVYLGYTVKPNVYGSLAAHRLGIPVINNIAGLGAVFIQDGWLVRVVRGLYRLALGRSATVFFQNNDDRQMFVAGGLVREAVAGLLPGSGIDLTRFAVPDGIASGTETVIASGTETVIASEARQSTGPVSSLRAKRGNPGSLAVMDCHGADAPRNDEGRFRFLLIARMLWDKGVGEYVEAAQLLRQRWPQAEFCLLGFVDVQNPAAISRAEMDAWVAQGFVNYLGVSDDVRTHIAEADCVVLPSYREGTPRTLLEAAAMGLPIVTTDAVGCREVVQDGHNGLLCKPRDAKDLAAKMERMLWLTPAQRAVMGLNGRKKMEAEFDEQIVIDRYLAAVREAVGQQPGLPRR